MAERTSLAEHDELTLVELVNRVADRGVVLGGELTISVADIDLLHVNLRLLLCSVDRLQRLELGNGTAAASSSVREGGA